MIFQIRAILKAARGDLVRLWFVALCWVGCSDTATGIETIVDQTMPTTPHDWKVEVVARAPTIADPSVVCCAADGRVFVAEDPMDISAPSANLALGRILCFHPDGKITVFAEKLYAVFGMQYLDGKLYVLHNPKFSVFRDDNGVGQDREELIESTNPNPWALDWNDHVPANFKFAMDGYFYIAVGDKGVYGATGKDGKRVDLHSGGILRTRPDGTGLEIFSTGVRNILDVAINAEDEIFTYDNTDERAWWSRLAHMVESGFYGYPHDFNPPREYTLPMVADYGGGAATGAFCYNEDALPPEYQGNLFLADFGRRQIMRLRVARDGATYKVVAREQDMANGPPEFRPVGITLSPDGMSMYVCDWNHSDTKENVQVGRLLKLSYLGESHATRKPKWYLPAAMGRTFEASAEDLIRGLSHPAQSVRLVAQRQLVGKEKQDPSTRNQVVSQLCAVLQDSVAPGYTRSHAIWTLDGIDGGVAARNQLLAAAENAKATIRLQAIRQLGARRAKEANSTLISLLKDSDAAIRFQSATSLGRIAEVSAVRPLLEALDEADFFTRFAVFTALNRIGRRDPNAWRTIGDGLEHNNPAVRKGTLLSMRETYELPAVEVLLKFIRNTTQPAETRVSALNLLSSLHHKFAEWKGEWWSYHPVDAPPPEKTVEWEGTALILTTLRDGLRASQALVRAASIEGLRLAKDSGIAPALRERFAQETDLECKRQILVALAGFKDPATKDLIASILKSPLEYSPILLDVLDALQGIGSPELTSALVEFLEARPVDSTVLLKTIQTAGNLKASDAGLRLLELLQHADPAVRGAALTALGQIGGESSVDRIIPLAMDGEREVRKLAITTLGKLKDKRAIPCLIEAFGKEETKFEAASALAQMPDVRALDAYLFGMSSANVVVRENCRKALAVIATDALPLIESRTSSSRSAALLMGELKRIYRDIPAARTSRLFSEPAKEPDPSEYLDFVMSNSGDATRGREFFYDPQGVACFRCHAGDHQGGEVGPNLASIGTQQNRQQLAESILYPNKAVRDGYRQEIVETVDGDLIAGAIKVDAAGELILQDAAGNKHRFRKSEIKERRASTLSLMPEGLYAGLSLQEFGDLVSFLQSLKGNTPQRR